VAADQLGLPPAQARELVLADGWREVAGDALAERVRALRVRRGTLEVELPEGPWERALADLVPRLAGRLAARRPQLGIARLRVVAAGATVRECPQAQPVPPPEERDLVPSPANARPPAVAPAPACAPAREVEPLEDRLRRAMQRYLRVTGRSAR
jgi:hypothetical protein